MNVLLLNWRFLLTSGRFHDQHYKKNQQNHFLELLLTSSQKKKKMKLNFSCLFWKPIKKWKKKTRFTVHCKSTETDFFEHVSSVTAVAWCWRGLSKWEATYFYQNSHFHTSGNISRFFFAISYQIQKALQDFLVPFSYLMDAVFCSITRALKSQASRYLPQDRTLGFFFHKENKLCKTGPWNSQWKLPLPSMRTAQCCTLDIDG